MQYNADTEDASVTNPVCDSSPESYARQRRLNSSLMTGGLFGVGSLLYFFATRRMSGISNTGCPIFTAYVKNDTA